MKNETLLYGRKLNSEEWEEEILCSMPEYFEKVKELAGKDGYGHFRIAEINLSEMPDFKKTIKK